MGASLLSRTIAGFLKILNFKKQVEKQSAQAIIKRSKKAFVPKIIHQKYKVSTEIIDKKTVATFEHKSQVSKTHFIFLHGGAYIFEASGIHWGFAQKLVNRIPCKITMVDYPLAPEHDYIETYAMVEKTYHHLIEKYPNDDFILIGDSAGAGLAMGFYQKLQAAKHQQLPSKLILLSPWLDLTMSNPDNEKLAAKDHILTIKMLQNAAQKYAKDADQNHYLLSPINGDLSNFPPTIIFYGTAELFYADCIKLQSIVRGNTNFIFKEYQDMQHDWAMFPIPESKSVMEDIAAFVEDSRTE